MTRTPEHSAEIFLTEHLAPNKIMGEETESRSVHSKYQVQDVFTFGPKLHWTRRKRPQRFLLPDQISRMDCTRELFGFYSRLGRSCWTHGTSQPRQMELPKYLSAKSQKELLLLTVKSALAEGWREALECFCYLPERRSILHAVDQCSCRSTNVSSPSLREG